MDGDIQQTDGGRVVWLLLGRAGVVGREATGTLETRRDAPCQGRAGGGWLEFVFRHGTRSLSVSRWLQMASAGGRTGGCHLCHEPLGVQQAHMHLYIDR